MTIGIYRLNFSGGSFYIGRSNDIEQRVAQHLSDIKLDKTNPKIKDALGSGESFSNYDVLEECTLEVVREREVYWINKLEAITKGLNILPGGGDPHFGEASPNSKYSNATILTVLEMLAAGTYSIKEITEKTGVLKGTITDITCEKKHLWLKSEYPELYERMKNNAKVRRANSLANLSKAKLFKTKLEILPKLVSPEGEIVEIQGTLTAFAAKHSLQLGNLSSVINGNRKTHKGWSLYKGS